MTQNEERVIEEVVWQMKNRLIVGPNCTHVGIKCEELQHWRETLDKLVSISRIEEDNRWLK